MAGRGPAPKIGDRLGHRAAARSGPNVPGDQQVKRWDPPAGPVVGWSDGALRWWEAAVGSLAAEQAWLDEDRPKLERLMWMVDHWWGLMASSPSEAIRYNDQIRRAEAELYLSPAERARAGLTPGKVDRPAQAQPSSRARLRSVDDAVG